ncbi:NAD(+) diphosphatase [Paucibacter sp. M5-1]|uniref:NAD(+) diphosphatase n=1 Tax=Paucibacter sp. M5-1 TaxID=3015998 RepID=UPI0022B8A24C|nr:NAD(+) diphosphatase [Paucibacter sp. M5-1]MCZ7880752.1 NAD(+) diphosphatase [Paucibacter sp. M5-1]
MQFHAAVFPAASSADPAASTAEAWHFVFVGGRLLLREQVLSPQPPALFEPVQGRRHYLGRLDERDCWALQLAEAPPGFEALPLRAAMMTLPEPLMQLAGRAAQVLEWERTHRFCGVCGTATEALAHERARRCPACGQVCYPRLSPAMMALVWRRTAAGPELLLARSPGYAPGFYSALAGFVEAGESLEDCVHREVAEEVGVRVTNLRYYGSQSWPFPHSLMVAYTAEWVDGEIVPQAGEIEDARWFPLDGLPGIPPRFSIAGHLIRDQVAALSEV